MITQRDEIINKAKRLQNGDVSRGMERMGIVYGLNYGVSIPQLRQLANQYPANTQLAFELLATNVREAKIIASMLIDAQHVTIEQWVEISQQINNLELVEQFSQNCYAYCPELPAICAQLAAGTYWQNLLSIYAISWYFKKQKQKNTVLIEWAILHINANKGNSDRLIQKAVGFLIQSLAHVNSQCKMQMLELAENMIKSKNASEQQLAQEFLWLNMV